MAEITYKTSARISQIFNNTWLLCYPRPRKIIFDNRDEYKKDFLYLLNDFSIQSTPITIKNPQVHSIFERVHQVLDNILKIKNLQKYDFDGMDPWSELLSLVACAICSTHHTTLQVSCNQLVFGRDILLKYKFVADWEAIRIRKKKDVDKSNRKENSLRIYHDYQVDDKVLITSNDTHRKLHCSTICPYPIVQVYSNCTAHVQNGIMTNCMNIGHCSR